MNKNKIIRESLIRYLAETQNNLESAKAKIDKAKKIRDALGVATFRSYKRVLESKIKDISITLKAFENMERQGVRDFNFYDSTFTVVQEKL